MKRFALALIALLAAANAVAAPIVYTQLSNGVPVLDEIATVGGSGTVSGARFFSFHSEGGLVTLDGSRIDGGYDMSFWLFSGLFADTDVFGSAFTGADPGFITFQDDDTPPAVPGPHEDPFFSGTLAAGWYTVAVTNFASNGNHGGDNMYDFSLTATGVNSGANNGSVPEPAGLALAGLALTSLALIRRRV
jgi:hypothetical protein